MDHRYKILSGLAIIIAVLMWKFLPHIQKNHPELLGEFSGCFKSDGKFTVVSVKISSDGNFSSGLLRTTVSLYQDKEGYSFLPKDKVISPDLNGKNIRINSGYPLLIRISEDRQIITLPSENSPEIQLHRAVC